MLTRPIDVDLSAKPAAAHRRRLLPWTCACGMVAFAASGIAQPMSFGAAPDVPPSFPSVAPATPAPSALEPTEGLVGGSRTLPMLAPQVRLGDLRSPFGIGASRFGTPPPSDPTRPWNIVPSLGLELLATDNALRTNDNRRTDLITSIIPSVLASADTPWLVGRLNYSPIAQIYASTPNQDRLDHRGALQGLATIVPETFFLDVRGFVTNRVVTGGVAPEGTAVVDRRTRAQTTNFQLSPYVVQRFGGDAVVQAGYIFQYANQEGNRAFLPGGSQPFFTPQEFTAHEGFAVARTGENFGRLALEARVNGTRYDGTGVLDNAHRAIGTVQARYALLRGVAALVEGGYESQRYSGVPPRRIDEPVWAVGVRLAPVPGSIIIARYGRRDGFNSPFLSASVPVGGRTRVYASYADVLTTTLRRDEDLLTATSLDALGNPVDATTGAPVLYSNSFLSLQSNLLRIRRFTTSVSQAWPRDVFTLSMFHEERRPVAVVPGTIAFEERGFSGSLAWAHDVSPRTDTVAYLQYGRSRSDFGGTSDILTADASLRYKFSEKLLGIVQYRLTNRGADLSVNRSLQNIFLVGLWTSL